MIVMLGGMVIAAVLIVLRLPDGVSLPAARASSPARSTA